MSTVRAARKDFPPSRHLANLFGDERREEGEEGKAERRGEKRRCDERRGEASSSEDRWEVRRKREGQNASTDNKRRVLTTQKRIDSTTAATQEV